MTEAEIRAAYLDWINRYCNQEFVDSEDPEENTIPPGVEFVLSKIVKEDPSKLSVVSESLEGLSQTFREGGKMDSYKQMLIAYRRLRVV